MVREREQTLPDRHRRTLIIRAGWIVPVSSPPLRPGCVRVVGSRLEVIGHSDGNLDADEIIDLPHAVLTPGLVNPHTHLELTAYAGQLEPGPLWRWLARLVRLRREPGCLEREQAAVRDGAWQSLQAGVTCVGDISRENLAWRILKPIPIRKVCFAELLSLADAPPRDPDELRAAVTCIEEDDLLTAGISPHAPYSVPERHLRSAVALADELDRPWCTHWAETRAEVGFLTGRPELLPAFLRALLAPAGVRSPRLSPGRYLRRCTQGLKPGLLAHGNYLAEDDAALVAAGGHHVAYCPRAHAFFGHPPHPFAELRRAGVPVVLGTDSAASNENLALLEEARFVHNQAPHAPPPADLLNMITLEAARALRLADRIGSLEPGKEADLAAFPAPAGVRDPVAYLVETAPRPLAVWVAGRRVA